MKKNISILIISILIIISFLYINSEKNTSISINSTNISIQSDLMINLVQTDKVTNLITFNKNELNTKGYEQKNIDFNVKNDGKIILQVKINDSEYETIIIPYTTSGNLISVINLKIEHKDNAFFITGDYDTMLEGSQEINSKLE